MKNNNSTTDIIDINNENNTKKTSIDPLLSIANEFNLDNNTFKAIVDGFKEECEWRLNTTSVSDLATMIPSYVTRMPTGDEKGTFLALDLGGSNLRVSAVELLGDGQVKVLKEIRWTVSDAQRTGSSTDFFDWMADAVGELLDNLPPHHQNIFGSSASNQTLAMGVCWSFPLDQTDICKGKVLRMGKGFTLDNIDGQDLTNLFHDAFKRKNINVTVTALLNDTVGTLVAHGYSNPGACIGFIHGTGVNAAYPEKKSSIVKLSLSSNAKTLNTLHGEGENNDGFMLVNTEIDVFGSEYLPITRFDKALDRYHSQPGFQAYEKMMSGAYLGELVRLIAVELITNHQYLFNGNITEQLKRPWSFTTATMSNLEKTETNEEKLAIFGEWHEAGCINDYVATIEDMERLTHICRIVSSRAAKLAAAGIAAIIERQNIITTSNDPIIIGVNGSTFEKYPHMQERVKEALHQWFGDMALQRIHLGVARDGGSIGGALVAMLYNNDVHEKRSNNPGNSNGPKVGSLCFPPLYHIKQALKRRLISKTRPKKNDSSSKGKQLSSFVQANKKNT